MSVFIVAECGVNWITGQLKDNKLSMAKKMLEVFKEVGADACKFQMYKPNQVMGHPRTDELQSLVFSPEMVKELKEYSETIGIEVFWTPMYSEAVDVLEKVEVNHYKIRSKDSMNTSLIRKVCATGKETFISVSNDRLDWAALDDSEARYRVKLLHCVEKYPAQDNEVHLKMVFPAMRSYISSTEYYGISDHTTGITCPIAAVAMGARMVEKHVKLDDKYRWIDNDVAITPIEFKDMVHHIRRTEVMRA